MNRIVLAFVITSFVSLVDAHKVTVDYGHGANLAGYKTYCWAGPPDVQALSQLMAERVTGFVEEALAARHFRRLETGCDLLIRFRITVQERPQFVTYTNSFGPTWDWDWGSSISTTTVEPILTSAPKGRQGMVLGNWNLGMGGGGAEP